MNGKTFNMILMSFLVVGIWYAVGYLQGYDQGARDIESDIREYGSGEDEGTDGDTK